MSKYSVYLKLHPYLAQYWYHAMKVKPGGQLYLPEYISKEIFLPYIIENKDFTRRCGQNDRGYEKDASSYSQAAYEFTTKSDQPPLNMEGMKIPTKEECNTLYPFAIPDSFVRTETDRVPVKATKYMDLKDTGATLVRRHLNEHFYILLDTKIKNEMTYYLQTNIPYTKSNIILKWMTRWGIDEEHLETIRRKRNDKIAKGFLHADPDMQ